MFTLPELSVNEILIYLRKSRTDDPSFTIEETVAKHEQRLDDFSMHTWGELVPEENRFREVVSGETVAARPEVQKVLRLIEQPRYKAVLIIEPQRLSRGDLEDIGRLVKLFRYTGTLVITPQGSFDLNDTRDRDFFERELMRGNDFLEYQKKIMGNGRVASVERGNFLGTVAPYGYRRVWLREGKKKSPSLEIEPGEAEVVRLIFRLFSEGQGASAICKHLNASGTPTRSGSPWRQSSVYTMLDNPVYIGRVRWFSTRGTLSVVGGEVEKHRLRQDDYPTFPGKHPAIIPDVLWDAVRARRAARNAPRVKSSRELINPFAGLVRCSCGAAVVMVTPPGAAPRLRCVERHVCGSASCRYSDFVEAVVAALKENLQDLETVAGGDPVTGNGAEITRLEKRVAALASKETALWEKYAEEGMPRAIFEELLEKTHTEQQQVSEMLAAERARASSAETQQAREVTLHGALDVLPVIERVPVREANRVLRACIRQITYTRGTAKRETGGNRGGWSREPIKLKIELTL